MRKRGRPSVALVLGFLLIINFKVVHMKLKIVALAISVEFFYVLLLSYKPSNFTRAILPYAVNLVNFVSILKILTNLSASSHPSLSHHSAIPSHLSNILADSQAYLSAIQPDMYQNYKKNKNDLTPNFTKAYL
jgi:hypothetical protein